MDGFTFNKIAGAVLGAALIGFLIIEVSHALYPNPRHASHVEQMGYPVEVAAHGEGDHGGGEEVVDEGPSLAELMAAADPARGEAAIRACVSCHTFEEGGANRVGPNLWNIVGRAVASVDGFGYSNAMQAHGGEWTYERLDAFLQRPRSAVPGTTMSYAGVRREGQRADMLAYLRTLSNNPVALPTPVAAPAPVEAAPAEPVEEAIEEIVDEAIEAVEDASDDAAEMTDDAVDDAVDVVEDAVEEAAEDAAPEGDDTE